MKKTIAMIALAAICFGTVSAAIPAKSVSDTTVSKTKIKKKPNKLKIKKKVKDTTAKM